MWIPHFLRRRPTSQPTIVLNSRGLRNQKKANKLRAINNEIKSILYKRLKNIGRPHVSEITMKELIEQTKKHMSNGNLNAKGSAFAVNIPNVANIGTKNFRAGNWPYAYTAMYNPEVNRYRKHPTKDYIIVHNETTGTWRRATNNENTKIRKRKPTYGNQRSF
jgi:hypothetical protein